MWICNMLKRADSRLFNNVQTKFDFLPTFISLSVPPPLSNFFLIYLSGICRNFVGESFSDN